MPNRQFSISALLVTGKRPRPCQGLKDAVLEAYLRRGAQIEVDRRRNKPVSVDGSHWSENPTISPNETES